MDRRPLIAGCLLLSALLWGCDDHKINYSQSVDLANDPADAATDASMDLMVEPDMPLDDLPTTEDLPEPDLPPLIPGCPGLEGLAGEAGCSFVWTHTPVPFSDQRPYALVLHNMDRAHVNEIWIDDSLTGGGGLELEPGQIYLWRPERAPALDNQELQTSFVEIQSSRALLVSAHTPWDAEGVGTADSSAVWPEHALGREHVVASWPGLDTAPPFVTILAAENGTEVSVQLPPGVQARGWGAERTRSLTLSRGQSWRIQGERGGDDLTGAAVSASAPVAVYSGTGCASTDPDFPLCDHIQHQMPPVESWGARTTVYGGIYGSGARLLSRVLAPPSGTNLSWSCDDDTGGDARLEASTFQELPGCAGKLEVEANPSALVVVYGTQYASLGLWAPWSSYLPEQGIGATAHPFSSGGENADTRVLLQGSPGTSLWMEDASGAQVWAADFSLDPVIPIKQGALHSDRFSSLLFHGEGENAGRLWTSGYLPTHRREP